MIRFASLLTAATAVALTSSLPADEKVEFFERKIRPILVEHCFECHSATSKPLQGGLRLDTAPLVLRGGDSGAALVKGDADASLIMEALRYEGLEMPPTSRLPDDVIRDFERWIAAGAVDPRGTDKDPVASKPRPYRPRSRTAILGVSTTAKASCERGQRSRLGRDEDGSVYLAATRRARAHAQSACRSTHIDSSFDV
jgi:hypothetical protein